MIPKKSTPIKHSVLIGIFASGLLTRAEMRVAFYVIRYSWGFDNGDRRRDWTLPIRVGRAAQEISMPRQKFSLALNSMVRRRILLRRESRGLGSRCFQFNEHVEEWLPRGVLSPNGDAENVTNRGQKVSRYGDVSGSFCHQSVTPVRRGGRAGRRSPNPKDTSLKKSGKGPAMVDFIALRAHEESLVARGIRYLEKGREVTPSRIRVVLENLPAHLHAEIRRWLDRRFGTRHAYARVKEEMRKEVENAV